MLNATSPPATSLITPCGLNPFFLGPAVYICQGFLLLLFAVLLVGFLLSLFRGCCERKVTKTIVTAFLSAIVFCCLQLSRIIIYLLYNTLDMDHSLDHEREVLHKVGHCLVMLVGFSLLVNFVRQSSFSKSQKISAVFFWLWGITAIAGRLASSVLLGFGYELTAKYLAMAAEFCFAFALVSATHSGGNMVGLAPFVQRLKGVTIFFFFRSIMVLSYQVWISDVGKTQFRDTFLTFLIDFLPLFAVLAATWSYMKDPTRKEHRHEENAWTGKLVAYLNREWLRIMFFGSFYISILLIFGWGAEGTCYSALAALEWPGILARASAKPMVFIAPILILAILHGPLGLLRRLSLNDVLPLEGNLNVHIHCAVMIIILTLIHIVGHIVILMEPVVLEKLNVPYVMLVWPWLSGWLMMLGVMIATISGFVYMKRKKCYFHAFFPFHLTGYLLLLLPIHGIARALHTFPIAWIPAAILSILWTVDFIYRQFGTNVTKLWRIRKAGKGDNFYWLEVRNMQSNYFPGGWVYLSSKAMNFEKHPFTICLAEKSDSISQQSDSLKRVNRVASTRERMVKEMNAAVPHPSLMWSPMPSDFERLFPSPGGGAGAITDSSPSQGFMKLSTRGVTASMLFEDMPIEAPDDLTENWETQNFWKTHRQLVSGDKGKEDDDVESKDSMPAQVSSPGDALQITGDMMSINRTDRVGNSNNDYDFGQESGGDTREALEQLEPLLDKPVSESSFWTLLEAPDKDVDSGREYVTLSFLIQAQNVRGKKSWTRQLLNRYMEFQEEIELVSLYDNHDETSETSTRMANFSLEVNGPFAGSAYSLMSSNTTHVCLVGMGSGVTAPLGLLSHFVRKRQDVWTTFVFAGREMEIVGEVIDVIRNICEGYTLPKGGVIVHLTSKEEFPDVELLMALRDFMDSGSAIERERCCVAASEKYKRWLKMARLFFGAKVVTELLGCGEENEDLPPLNWDVDMLKRMIALLKNSIFHNSFASPMENTILLRGRPNWPSLCTRIQIAAIMHKSAVPMFSIGELLEEQKHRPESGSRLKARSQFTDLDCLYTGSPLALKDLTAWTNENNAKALSGYSPFQSTLKAIWKVHGEVWS